MRRRRPEQRATRALGSPRHAEGLEFFALAVLEAVTGVVRGDQAPGRVLRAIRLGGFSVLERLIAEARDADVLVIADAKRGDFGLTNEGYAAGLAARSGRPSRVDAVTVQPLPRRRRARAVLRRGARESVAASSCWRPPRTRRVARFRGARTDEDGRASRTMVLRRRAPS